MDVSKIFNANVYVGTSSLLGKAKDFTLPKVTTVEDEHTALGMVGKLAFPMGIELLEANITWAGFYADALERSLDPFTYQKLQVRASVEKFGPGGRTEQTPLICHLTARWKDTPLLGTLAAQTAAETQETLVVNYVKLLVGGEELLELDVEQNIWRVKGRDLLETYRANLGI